MTDPLKRFFGTWIFDRDESEFDQGELPQSATLTIEDAFGTLKFTMTSVAADGSSQTDSFVALPNGGETRLGKSGLADAMRHGLRGDNNLVSEALRGGVPIMVADRELSPDGRTLTVTQTVHVTETESFVNTAIYHKAQ
ncbi:hypothetical protein GWI72_19205 [Microvirga tunisiensis]|uniref:Uncharacterized protein n=2 Tax=Pannonibacter tanglangensis TaxID=2750084 RepID=A0A7X5F635_9HYPH|nr:MULTISPECIES: hypothetical protein [unclassified Pannonibacter]NBN65893.1 hypothetical protein [Pannonibacter sp. XCT-34]NBN80411.1 hypothetical protein [Pannonibacter sp. XCT-53]